MSLRVATPDEIATWNRWLRQSHGLRRLPNAVIYHCNIDFPMLLTPWKRFDDFTLRVERDTNQPIMTFRLDGDVRTIAGFWSDPGFPRTGRSRWTSLQPFEGHVLDAAANGLLWWGIEYPPESVLTTSFIRWFPRSSFLAPEAQKALQPDPPPQGPLETPLDLI